MHAFPALSNGIHPMLMYSWTILIFVLCTSVCKEKKSYVKTGPGQPAEKEEQDPHALELLFYCNVY